MVVRLITSAILLSFISIKVQAEERLADQVIGEHEGYLSSVKEERYLRVVKMVLAKKPQQQKKLDLNRLVFDLQISQELSDQYKARFSRIGEEQNLNISNRYTDYEYSSGARVTLEEDMARRRSYGEYMFRRLVEHHFDKYTKSSPNHHVRSAYELKEKIGKINLRLKKGYKVKLHYSFSGNYMDIKLKNPYKLKTKVTLQMDNNSFDISKINEAVWNCGYPLNSGIFIDSYYYFDSTKLSLVGQRRLYKDVSFSLTGSTHMNNNRKESQVIIGLRAGGW